MYDFKLRMEDNVSYITNDYKIVTPEQAYFDKGRFVYICDDGNHYTSSDFICEYKGDSDMKQKQKQPYTTKPIDYTGCDPVIEEHLKRGLAILCKNNCGSNGFIIGYRQNSPHPYMSEFSTYSYATPIKIKTKVKKKIVKKFSEIVKWFEDRGATFRSDGSIINTIPSWYPNMISYCGGEPDSHYHWHPDWLEEREVEVDN